MTDSPLKIPVARLTWHCDAELPEFRTTEELPDLEGMLGQ